MSESVLLTIKLVEKCLFSGRRKLLASSLNKDKSNTLD